MATYISKATGNWGTTSTWAPAATGASCAQPTHSTTQTIAGNASVTSGTFTITNGQIIDGVLLFIRGGPTGTVTVELLKGGVSQASVTVNNSDLINGAQNCTFFKFTSTHTSDGSSTYAIKVSVSSGGSTITFYRDGTAGNFSRQLRQTAAASAAAAGDVWVVVGELTGAGTSNSFTVTMDDTGTNAYGTNTQTVTTVPHTTQNGVDVGNKGTLTWATASGTYQLHLKGHLVVWGGGTLNIGTVGTPMPDGVVGELYFDNDAAVKFGLELGDQSTCVLQGLNKTHMQYLAADAAAAATSLTLDGTPTNWKDQDEVAFASTTRTSTEAEIRTVNGNVSSTALAITAGLTNAHAGGGVTNGALVKAEVINVTRNVRVKGNSGFKTYVSFINLGTGISFDADYAEFKYIGSVTAAKRGFDMPHTSSSWNMNGCVLREGDASAIGLNFTAVSGLNYVVTNTVGWNVPNGFFVNVGTSATGWQVDNCVAISCGGSGFNFTDVGGSITNITATSGTGGGIFLNEGAGTLGAFSGIVSHSNGSQGISINAGNQVRGLSISNIISYRNNSTGVIFSGSPWFDATISSLTIFGNNGNGLNNTSVNHFVGVKFVDLNIDTGLVLTQTTGIQPQGYFIGVTVFNSTITSSANSFNPSVGVLLQATLFNTVLGAPTEINSQSSLGAKSLIGSVKHDQTAGLNKAFLAEGTISTDTSIFDTSPSARLTPLSATFKLECEVAVAEVANGQAVTFSVKVRKSVVGDGAAYNGAQPRLILKRNDGAGIVADTVLDTATNAANGAWVTLSGTTAAVTDDSVLTCVVDCDGTAGWVNVDTATAS